MGTKLHLQPLNAFSGLLVRPKCIYGRGCTLNLAGGAYSTLPDAVACGAPSYVPLLRSQPLASNFGPLNFSSLHLGLSLQHSPIHLAGGAPSLSILFHSRLWPRISALRASLVPTR